MRVLCIRDFDIKERKFDILVGSQSENKIPLPLKNEDS